MSRPGRSSCILKAWTNNFTSKHVLHWLSSLYLFAETFMLFIGVMTMMVVTMCCWWHCKTLLSGFSLDNWLRENGGEITAQLSTLLMEELGIKQFLLDRPCQGDLEPYNGTVGGWNNGRLVAQIDFHCSADYILVTLSFCHLLSVYRPPLHFLTSEIQDPECVSFLWIIYYLRMKLKYNDFFIWLSFICHVNYSHMKTLGVP